MGYDRGRSSGFHRAVALAKVGLGALAMIRGMAALVLAGTIPVVAAAQQPATVAPSLVFDGVTVVDVERGKLVPNRRVVIVGNRIQTVGAAKAVRAPRGARIVDARDKYLIPGLWDLHTHPSVETAATMYPLFLANGVTGIRNAASDSLDTFIRWRREILEGRRVGPPRQILASVQVNDSLLGVSYGPCHPFYHGAHAICPTSPAEVRRLVDSFQTAGADMIKTYILTPAMYFALAAEARRVGIPFGGHVNEVPPLDASDSGARIIDHFGGDAGFFNRYCTSFEDSTGIHHPTVQKCLAAAERLRKNDTWWVPTIINRENLPTNPALFDSVRARLSQIDGQLQSGSIPSRDWLHGVIRAGTIDSFLSLVERANMPLLTGTDEYQGVGFALHAELATFVALGLTPLNALQAATLNPAKMFHATDSLGTVAAGKLADLVLLDADPLADITNTTMLRAVVANGRYFDRAALDQLLTQVVQTPRP